MTDEVTLVELLRTNAVTNGSISLRRIQGGGWSAVISHHRQSPDHLLEHMTHLGDASLRDDPVEALRIALIEDERLCRDLRRRYDTAPKLGEVQPRPVVGSLPVLDPDFDAEDCLG